MIAEGSVEARCFEVLTKRKLVFAEAPRKLAGGRVVISREINIRNENHRSEGLEPGQRKQPTVSIVISYCLYSHYYY